jgi:hypothetical protein
MGWSIGYDNKWERDIGYGVPESAIIQGATKKSTEGLRLFVVESPTEGIRGVACTSATTI